VARLEKRFDACRVLMGKPEGYRPLVRLRRRWEDNIKNCVKNIGWEIMDWIDLIQDRVN